MIQYNRRKARLVDLIQSTNIPKVMGDQGYAELFQAYRTLTAPTEWATLAQPTIDASLQPRPPGVIQPTLPAAAAPTHAPQPVLPTAAAPTPTPSTPSQPKRQRRSPARPRLAMCSPPETRPGGDGSTTGVGRLDHSFPDSLSQYTVYNERPSRRRAPTQRSREQWARRPGCQ
ncbi:hypothetical protein AB1Y20_014443 [Prymnesium parvum]|uniref:Uncharacterized protein n=1 Tax=Prymnesium parvum TaxID=97485 RepID=A0AB34IFW5_PRYPA